MDAGHLLGPTDRWPGAFRLRASARAKFGWPARCRTCFTTTASLLIEAGTGTGKTWAYLIPAVLSGRRVLVSTGTRALQDQIMEKICPP